MQCGQTGNDVITLEKRDGGLGGGMAEDQGVKEIDRMDKGPFMLYANRSKATGGQA